MNPQKLLNDERLQGAMPSTDSRSSTVPHAVTSYVSLFLRLALGITFLASVRHRSHIW